MEQSKESDSAIDLGGEIDAALEQIHAFQLGTRGKTQELVESPDAPGNFLELNKRILQSMRAQIPALENSKKIDFRINQLRSMSKFVQFLAKGGNAQNIGYLRQPTGSGKTVLYALMAFLMNQQTVIFVPKVNLLHQAIDDMVNLIGIPREKIGIVGDGNYQLGRQFTIVTYDSHRSKMDTDTNTRSDKAYTDHINQCRVVICDEAHKSMGEQTDKARSAVGVSDSAGQEVCDDVEMTEEEVAAEQAFMEHIGELRQENPQLLTLGFTATTEARTKSVHQYFKELIAQESYKELVEAGILVNFESIKGADAVVYSNETENITTEQEGEILEREDVYDQLTDSFLDLQERESPLYTAVFCASHEECLKYQKIAHGKDIKTMVVTSHEKQRDKKILEKAEKALLTGEIDQIITVDVLTEGWNLPPVNCIVMASASQSPAKVVQRGGRAGRCFEGDMWKGTQLKQGYKKEKAFLLEVDWSEQVPRFGEGEGGPRAPSEEELNLLIVGGEKPMSFAQALAYCNEDPDGVVEREGGRLDVVKKLDSETTEVDGRRVYTAAEYVADPSKEITRARLDSILSEAIRTGQIRSVPNTKKKGLLVYYEDDLDRIVVAAAKAEEKARLERDATAQVEDDPNTIKFTSEIDTAVLPDGREVVILQGVVRMFGLEKGRGDSPQVSAVQRWITDVANIKPIEEYNSVLLHRTGGSPCNIYLLSEVVAAISRCEPPRITRVEQITFPVDGRLELSADPNRQDSSLRWATTVKSVIEKYDLDNRIFGHLIKKSQLGIKPLKSHGDLHQFHVKPGGNKPVRKKCVGYWESDLTSLVTLILNQKSELPLPDLRSDAPTKTRVAITLSAMASQLAIGTSELRNKLAKDGTVSPVHLDEVFAPDGRSEPMQYSRDQTQLYEETDEDGLFVHRFLANPKTSELNFIEEHTSHSFTTVYWKDELLALAA